MAALPTRPAASIWGRSGCDSLIAFGRGPEAVRPILDGIQVLGIQ
jgi:hypothetical protein